MADASKCRTNGLSEKTGWRSLLFILVWLGIGCWQFREIYKVHPDLVFSIFLVSIFQTVIAFCLRRGAWQIMKPAMLSVRMWLLFSFFLWGTFTKTSLLAGDFGSDYFRDYACLGLTHVHHWAWRLLDLAVLMIILMQLACNMPKRAILVSVLFGGLCSLGTLLGVVAYPIFQANPSLRTILFIDGVIFLYFAWMISEAKTKEFSWGTSILIALVLSICVNGLFGIGLDLRNYHVPKPLIFFNDPQCKQ